MGGGGERNAVEDVGLGGGRELVGDTHAAVVGHCGRVVSVSDRDWSCRLWERTYHAVNDQAPERDQAQTDTQVVRTQSRNRLPSCQEPQEDGDRRGCGKADADVDAEPAFCPCSFVHFGEYIRAHLGQIGH